MVLVKMKPRGVEFSLGTYMKCVGHHEIKPQVYENFTEKNKFKCANSRLKHGLMYLY